MFENFKDFFNKDKQKSVNTMTAQSIVTCKLVFLLVGLLFLYLLQKNGNFFPVFFVSTALFLLYKHKSGDKRQDLQNLLIGFVLGVLSLHPVYALCIAPGYVAAQRVFVGARNKILLLPGERKELFSYGLLLTFLLIMLNTVWQLQTDSINFALRLSAVTAGLIAAIPEELLFRYLLFALCVHIAKDRTFSKLQNFICYLILIVPHVLMHFQVGTAIAPFDLALMSIFGIALAYIQRKSSLVTAIVVHFLIDCFRFTIFGV